MPFFAFLLIVCRASLVALAFCMDTDFSAVFGFAAFLRGVMSKSASVFGSLVYMPSRIDVYEPMNDRKAGRSAFSFAMATLSCAFLAVTSSTMATRASMRWTICGPVICWPSTVSVLLERCACVPAATVRSCARSLFLLGVLICVSFLRRDGGWPARRTVACVAWAWSGARRGVRCAERTDESAKEA